MEWIVQVVNCRLWHSLIDPPDIFSRIGTVELRSSRTKRYDGHLGLGAYFLGLNIHRQSSYTWRNLVDTFSFTCIYIIPSNSGTSSTWLPRPSTWSMSNFFQISSIRGIWCYMHLYDAKYMSKMWKRFSYGIWIPKTRCIYIPQGCAQWRREMIDYLQNERYFHYTTVPVHTSAQ